MHLYDAAIALGALLALGAPVAAGRVATRRADGSMPARSRVRQGAMAGLCTGAAAALVVAALSTATIALLPYDAGLRNWAAGHIGQWTPVVGQVAPVVGTRVGYVAGNSAFAAGYLIVLLLSPWRAVPWVRGPAGQAAAPILLARGGRKTVRPPRTPRLGHHRRPGTGWSACTCGTASRC